MIRPDKIQVEAKNKEDENYEFRSFLKMNADEEELDQQFRRLHEELFADYDCSQCRNCCKMYKGSIPKEDIERDAQYLGITAEQFIDFFLEKEESEASYSTKHKPCDFLQKDGACKLGECRPDSCKKYPYTNQPERLHSLLGMLDIVEICPVAFEIFERLKKEYGFREKATRHFGGRQQSCYEVAGDEDDWQEPDPWSWLEPEAVPQPYVRSAPKVGRNDPCPCGSGKKYKKCCGGNG